MPTTTSTTVMSTENTVKKKGQKQAGGRGSLIPAHTSTVPDGELQEQWLASPLANLTGFSGIECRFQSMFKSIVEICSQILAPVNLKTAEKIMQS